MPADERPSAESVVDWKAVARGLFDALESLHYPAEECPYCLPGSPCRAQRRLNEWYKMEDSTDG